MARTLTGEFTAANQASDWFDPGGGPFHFWAGEDDGAAAGTVELQVTPDDGATVLNATLPSGADNAWAVPVFQAVPDVWTAGLKFRLKCSAFTSGPIRYGIITR